MDCGKKEETGHFLPINLHTRGMMLEEEVTALEV
jgi:hypothetical protein